MSIMQFSPPIRLTKLIAFYASFYSHLYEVLACETTKYLHHFTATGIQSIIHCTRPESSIIKKKELHSSIFSPLASDQIQLSCTLIGLYHSADATMRIHISTYNVSLACSISGHNSTRGAWRCYVTFYKSSWYPIHHPEASYLIFNQMFMVAMGSSQI